MIPKYILKQGSEENLDNFLNKIQKLSNKKRQFINITKLKLGRNKQKPKTVMIDSFDNLGKKYLLILILTPIVDKSVIDKAMIDIDPYYIDCKFKRAWVLVVFI